MVPVRGAAVGLRAHTRRELRPEPRARPGKRVARRRAGRATGWTGPPPRRSADQPSRPGLKEGIKSPRGGRMPAGAAELGVPACDGDPAATGARPWQFPLRPYTLCGIVDKPEAMKLAALSGVLQWRQPPAQHEAPFPALSFPLRDECLHPRHRPFPRPE